MKGGDVLHEIIILGLDFRFERIAFLFPKGVFVC